MMRTTSPTFAWFLLVVRVDLLRAPDDLLVAGCGLALSTRTTIVLSIALETTIPRRSFRCPLGCSGFGQADKRTALARTRSARLACGRCALARRCSASACATAASAGRLSRQALRPPRRGLRVCGWSLRSFRLLSGQARSSAGSAPPAERSSAALGDLLGQSSARRAPRSARSLAPASAVGRRVPRRLRGGLSRRASASGASAAGLGSPRLGLSSSSFFSFVPSTFSPAVLARSRLDGQDASDLALRRDPGARCSRARRSPPGSAG